MRRNSDRCWSVRTSSKSDAISAAILPFLPLPRTDAMNQREEKVDDYSSDEEKRTASEKSMALDAVDDSERTRGVVAMEGLSARLNRNYWILLYGGFALLGKISFPLSFHLFPLFSEI